MRLLKSAYAQDHEVCVPCSELRHEGVRMFALATGYADLDGKPFAAYLCERCANRYYPNAVLSSETRKEDPK